MHQGRGSAAPPTPPCYGRGSAPPPTPPWYGPPGLRSGLWLSSAAACVWDWPAAFRHLGELPQFTFLLSSRFSTILLRNSITPPIPIQLGWIVSYPLPPIRPWTPTLLHCFALRCILALHCAALYCIASLRMASRRMPLHCTGLHRITLRCTSLNCIAPNRIKLYGIAPHAITFFNVLVIKRPEVMPSAGLQSMTVIVNIGTSFRQHTKMKM